MTVAEWITSNEQSSDSKRCHSQPREEKKGLRASTGTGGREMGDTPPHKVSDEELGHHLQETDQTAEQETEQVTADLHKVLQSVFSTRQKGWNYRGREGTRALPVSPETPYTCPLMGLLPPVRAPGSMWGHPDVTRLHGETQSKVTLL